MRAVVLALAFVSSLLVARTAHATHFRGGTLNYRIPNPANPRVVELEVTVAWRSNFQPVDSTTLAFGDGTTAPTTVGIYIGDGFDAVGGQYAVYRYRIQHTYPAPGQYVASFTSCCRQSSLINAADTAFTVRAVVDATAGNTAGPIAGAPPMVQLQTGGVRTLLIPARDPDGPISCAFSTATEAGDSIIVSPPSANGVVPTIEVTTDGCLVTWNLTSATANTAYMLSVVISSKNPTSTAIGKTTVETNVQLVTTPPITCTGSGSLAAYVTESATRALTAQASSPTNLTASLVGEIASLSPKSGTSPLASTATFTTVPSQQGLRLDLVTFTTPTFSTGWCYLFVDVQPPTCGNGHYELDACDGTSLSPGTACPIGFAGTPLCNNDPANPNGDGSCTLDTIPDGCADIDECGLGTDACAPQAICTNTEGAYSCACDTGWTGNGFSCDDIDECAMDTDACDPHALCLNTMGAYSCACEAGWSGDGFTCMDVDECADQGTCDANASCSNTAGAFSCMCNAGWEGNGFTCTDIDECAMDTDGCDPHATCANTMGAYSCTCIPGWAGNGFTCTDVDECAEGTSTCGEHSICTNTTGGYMCACQGGWTGDGLSCADVDECTAGTAHCDPHATCTNLEGGFSCACMDGWLGSGASCGDVDECDEGLDDCPNTSACVNDTGGFHCACPAGFTGDGYTCTPENDGTPDPMGSGSGGCGCAAGGDGDQAIATWLFVGGVIAMTRRRSRRARR